MSKFIITNKKLLKNEVIEVETAEEALAIITEKTIQIIEEYPNGKAIVHKSDLEDMIVQKQAAVEYEEENAKKEKVEKDKQNNQ